MKNIDIFQTDVLVAGSGGAGLRAAIAAADGGASVLLVSKGKVGMSGATVTAVSDVSVDSCSALDLGFAGNREDSPEIFMEDIMRGGAYLNAPALVERFVHEIPARMVEMLRWGAKTTNFSISPGHRYPRAVIINGHNFATTLLGQVKQRNNIQILEHAVLLDLCKRDGVVCGAWGLDLKTGKYLSISAKSVVLATGGAMNVFPVTTAPNDLLGDGISMALRAGADLRDMEFQTFMLGCAAPTALLGNNYSYILVCRSGAHLYNREGERFMLKAGPERAEKTTRDKLAIAVAKELLEGRGGPNGGVWVSVKHLPDNLFTYYQQWYESGLGFKSFDPKNFLPDLRRDAVEAAPAAHFWCGGITIDRNCRTTLPGLYAAGECSGGLHGANRLSGNAMAEIIAMGNIAGQVAASDAAVRRFSEAPGSSYFDKCEAFFSSRDGEDALTLKKSLQKTAWESIGPIRNGETLAEALSVVKNTRKMIPRVRLSCQDRIYNREWLDALSIENICDCLQAVALSAQERTESRGSHYRTDYQNEDSKLYVTHVQKVGNYYKTYRRNAEEQS